MGRRFVPVQVGENRRQPRGRRAPVRLAALPVHVDDELGLLGEELLLSLGIPAIGAVRVGIDERPNRQAVRELR